MLVHRMCILSVQRWKWLIFHESWPMTHDLWPLAITSFHPAHGTRRGVAWWYWTTFSVLRAKNHGSKLSLQLYGNRTTWVSSFLMSCNNKTIASYRAVISSSWVTLDPRDPFPSLCHCALFLTLSKWNILLCVRSGATIVSSQTSCKALIVHSFFHIISKTDETHQNPV